MSETADKSAMWASLELALVVAMMATALLSCAQDAPQDASQVVTQAASAPTEQAAPDATPETMPETEPATTTKEIAPEMTNPDQTPAPVEDFATAQATYLIENGTKEGVTVTESGLQYRVISSSGGADRPSAADAVTVHYAGRLIDGTEFDSSYARGETITFPLNRVIPGWTEGLQQMAIGDKFELTIPAYLAYGDRGAGADIPGGATLVFDVELFAIER